MVPNNRGVFGIAGLWPQKCFPCCWGLFDSNNQPLGRICGHVGDFLFGGSSPDVRWQEICHKIQQRFRWTDWKTNKFVQRGLTIEQKENYEFVLSQEDFLGDVADMMSLTVQLLSRRKQQMRSILGCLLGTPGRLPWNGVLPQACYSPRSTRL